MLLLPRAAHARARGYVIGRVRLYIIYAVSRVPVPVPENFKLGCRLPVPEGKMLGCRSTFEPCLGVRQLE